MTTQELEIEQQAQQAMESLLAQAKCKSGDLVVVGCSSSEILGSKIGTASSMETAQAVLRGILPVLKAHGLQLAAQCCEHLNRALIVEQHTAEQFGYEPVNVIPAPKAGGSLQQQHGKPLNSRLLWSLFGQRQDWISAALSSECTLDRSQFRFVCPVNRLVRQSYSPHGYVPNL